MRKRDPRFFLILSIFWIAYALHISGTLPPGPALTTPRAIGLIASLVAATVYFIRFLRGRRNSTQS